MHRLAVAIPHTITDVLEKEATLHHYDPTIRDASFIEHLDLVFLDITPDIYDAWMVSTERAGIQAIPAGTDGAQSQNF